MKVMPIDPNNTTPEILASHVVEFVANEKPDVMICMFGKVMDGTIVPAISYSTTNLERLLYLKYCLEVEIRRKTEVSLRQCLEGNSR